jgi:sterol 14-demethylase
MSGILPPTVSGGLPVLGHALETMRDREKLFTRGYREHGDVFAI